MLSNLEIDIIKILSEKEIVKKEEIIIKINLEKQRKQEVGLGYRAFKSIIQSLENKSLIKRLSNSYYQLTASGKQELQKWELSLAIS